MIDNAHRERLRRFADVLIPAAHGMPGAGEIEVADSKLDRVLAVRDDLAAPLVRALDRVDPADHDGSLARLESDDTAAHDALLLVIVGGYYIDPEVRRRLGYDGQEPTEVRPEIIPDYAEEGLIEPLLDRGPIYREVPESDPSNAPVPGVTGVPDGELASTRHQTGRR
jgi:hypothetical protein